MHAPRLDRLARTVATTPWRPVLNAAVAATPGPGNGQRCPAHETCGDIVDCSGAVCGATPGCVDVRSDAFPGGGGNRECDDACWKGECCFPSSGQVCLRHGC